jgi:CheY-specific phosphatase CheX
MMGAKMDRCDQAMHHSVVDTLENMVFMEVTPEEGLASPPISADRMTVSLLIHDPVQGELRLSMPRSLTRKMTEAMYCLSAEELTEQMLNDNLAEIINIIAGRFMNEILDDGQTFRLGLPELEPTDIIDPGMETREWKFSSDGDEFTLVAIGKELLCT